MYTSNHHSNIFDSVEPVPGFFLYFHHGGTPLVVADDDDHRGGAKEITELLMQAGP